MFAVPAKAKAIAISGSSCLQCAHALRQERVLGFCDVAFERGHFAAISYPSAHVVIARVDELSLAFSIPEPGADADTSSAAYDWRSHPKGSSTYMSLIKLNGPSKFPATFPPHKDVFLAKKVFPKHSDADVAEVGFRAETTGSGLYGCENHLAGNFCDDQTLKGH